MNPAALQRTIAILGCTALSANAGLLSDDDSKSNLKEESALVLPAPPQADNLLRYTVGPGSTMTFAVDAKSISVGDDQIVRYSSVITSSSGVTNISYEGIRCKTTERKLYATGRPDGSWNNVAQPEWRRISAVGANSYQATLMKEFFCDGESIAGKPSAMVDRLRRKKPLR